MAKRDDMSKPVKPSEADLFTDREEFLDAFEEALTDLTPDAPKALVFHGPPGIGKSAITQELLRQLKKGEYPGAQAWGSFQFDDNVTNTPDAVMFKIVRNLDDTGGIFFPAFEVAWAVYQRKKYPHIGLNPKNNPLLKAGSIALSVATIFDPKLGLAKAVTGAFQKIEPKIREKFKEWYAKKGLEELRGIEYQEPDKILPKLPRFIGADLKQYLERDKKPVIFLDNYETQWITKSTEDVNVDEWVRDLIAACPGALFVISSRNTLPWGDIEGEDWDSYIDDNEVPDFKEGYARELLGKAGITDKAIIRAIIKGAKGVPIWVSLCVDIYYRKLKERTPTAEDFPDTHRKIFSYFMRDVLDANEKDVLEILSTARFFDVGLYKELKEQFDIHFPVRQFRTIIGYPFVLKAETAGTYRIHDLLRRHTQEYMNEELRSEVHTFLFEHYKRMVGVENPMIITEENVTALGEALYHGLQTGDNKEIADWFNRAFQIYERAEVNAELTSLYKLLIEGINEG